MSAAAQESCEVVAVEAGSVVQLPAKPVQDGSVAVLRVACLDPRDATVGVRVDNNTTGEAGVAALLDLPRGVNSVNRAFPCRTRGAVQLTLDNSRSWLRSVRVEVALDVVPPAGASGGHVASERACVVVFAQDLPEPVVEAFCTTFHIFRVVESDLSLLLARVLAAQSSGRRLLGVREPASPMMQWWRDDDAIRMRAGEPMGETLTSRLGADLHPFLRAVPSNASAPRMVLGTMTMDPAYGLDDRASASLLRAFVDYPDPEHPLGLDELDTARAYGYGATEQVLKRVMPYARKDSAFFRIATKVNAFPRMGGSLAPASVKRQVAESLAALGTAKVQILYLHGPDPNTPVETTLEALNELHKQGGFAELGLSNFASWQVVYIHALCTAKGWVRPTVYQGLYNVLARQVEAELLPALRALHIRFYAYNPLAGGLLVDAKKRFDAIPRTGRYKKGEMGDRYRERYWHRDYFDAVEALRQASAAVGISLQHGALRWLAHHSGLRTEAGDAIILGASTAAHLVDNINAVARGGPLPLVWLEAADRASQACLHHCPKYFR